MVSRVWWGATVALLVCVGASSGAPRGGGASAPVPPDDGGEFFEQKVRPVLVAQCVSCHTGAEPAGGLRLDQPAALRKYVSAGKPNESRLVRAVRYADPALQMPPSGKLPAEEVAAFEEWVRRGAHLPKRAASPAPAGPAGFPLAERRRHWAYQPVKRPAVPKVKTAAWGRNPVDAFVLARLEASGLKPAPPADRRTLLRRVTFDLTGLPPTPAEVSAFLADKSPDAYEKVVDRLLASPHYGERWARHWLDLVRYGETLGHEFDFDIPNAYRYRDYVIRALNADVPYDRFVKEHLAGDLLPDPRRDPQTGLNESVAATGFWWLGEGKHSPVDLKQEQADRIDNQIDVFGKAFLGQTLACARCHDHKFDPIPTKDYYSLYGVLASSRYQQAHLNAPGAWEKAVQGIDAAKAAVPRPALAASWKAVLERLSDNDVKAATLRDDKRGKPGEPLPPFSQWRPSGEAFAQTARPGDLLLTGDQQKPFLALIGREAAHSATRSRRLEGVLRSPTFPVNHRFLHLKVSGKQARVRVIVENFVVIRDPLYGRLNLPVGNDAPLWHTIDLQMVQGRRAYVELSDSALDNLSLGDVAAADKPFGGWVRLDAACLSDDGSAPADAGTLHARAVADIRAALNACLDRWAAGQTTGADAEPLDALDRLLRNGFLPAPGAMEAATARIAEAEAGIPAPVRAPAMCDGNGLDENVFLRGSHKTPGEAAPRLQPAFCFRETTPPPAEAGSGRRELAEWVASPSHPLTARVMANRLWKHHFGAGIVPTTDDFGHMGERPSDPALLDWLASEFAARRWSLKAMHRLLVLSSAYRMSSTASDPVAEAKDPTNRLLHRMPVRRLEAEAIRDGILAVSGRLDPAMYGPSVPAYITEFSEGRGRPGSGPLDGEGRRSIYLGVRRNFLSSWMLAFDFPTPFTCIGRRTVSNVPAQALALMNGPFVRQQAGVWAARLLRDAAGQPPSQRVAALYEAAFSRPPTPAESDAALKFLGESAPTGKAADAPRDAWADLCHVLLNVKEFVFVR